MVELSREMNKWVTFPNESAIHYNLILLVSLTYDKTEFYFIVESCLT